MQSLPPKVQKVAAVLAERHPQSDGYGPRPVRISEHNGIYTLTVRHPSGGATTWEMIASGTVHNESGYEDTYLMRRAYNT